MRTGHSKKAVKDINAAMMQEDQQKNLKDVKKRAVEAVDMIDNLMKNLQMDDESDDDNKDDQQSSHDSAEDDDFFEGEDLDI